jgi:hypothetical protein
MPKENVTHREGDGKKKTVAFDVKRTTCLQLSTKMCLQREWRNAIRPVSFTSAL